MVGEGYVQAAEGRVLLKKIIIHFLYINIPLPLNSINYA